MIRHDNPLNSRVELIPKIVSQEWGILLLFDRKKIRYHPPAFQENAMQLTVSLHKTVSRLVIEVIIITGCLSIAIGILQKLFHLGSIYDPRLLGLTPMDFLAFGGICFILAIAVASRRILKHLEFLIEKK